MFSENFCPRTKIFTNFSNFFLKIFALGQFFSRTKIPVTGPSPRLDLNRRPPRFWLIASYRAVAQTALQKFLSQAHSKAGFKPQTTQILANRYRAVAQTAL